MLSSRLWISSLLLVWPTKIDISRPFRYVFGRCTFEFHKNQMGIDVIVTPFKFCTIQATSNDISVVDLDVRSKVSDVEFCGCVCVVTSVNTACL